MDTSNARTGLRSFRVLLALLVATEAFDVSRPAAQGIVFGPGPGGSQGPIVLDPGPGGSPAPPVNVPCQYPEASREKAGKKVWNRSQLEAELAKGTPVVWIENSAAIDLSIGNGDSNYALSIPANVTIASGRSATQTGGLLYFSQWKEKPRFMLRLGACSRVTGLRLRGPSRDTTPDRPPSVAIAIREVPHALVDNNEVFDWPSYRRLRAEHQEHPRDGGEHPRHEKLLPPQPDVRERIWRSRLR